MRKRIGSLLLLSILLFSAIAVFSTAKADTVQKTEQEKIRNVNEIIARNQLLMSWQNVSDQIGVGTVKDVTCKLEKLGDGQTIFTYAEISVDVPLTDKLNANQTIVAKYLGGQVGNLSLRVDMLWPYFPNDTVTPPGMFRLSKGQSVMFFVEETTNALAGYIPYTIGDTAIGDTSSEVSFGLLSTEPQPTTGVLESAGYGFAANFSTWGDYIEWDDMPWQFHIDPDGTPDISGDDELAAIPPAFYAWENPPYYTIDFVEGDQYDPGDHWQNYTHPDDINSVGWVPDFQGSLTPIAVGFCWNDPQGTGHIVETDIALNDEYTWHIGSTYDVQDVVTHEVGHALGLGDLEDSSNSIQTMKHPYHGGEQTLEWGDLNGVHYLYPEHDDAGSGGDVGGSPYGGSLYVDRNVWYTGRLCYLPGDEDGSDYYTLYAPSTMRVEITLIPAAYADFDLELYYPDGSLADYARTEGPGWTEHIARYPIGGYGGFWTIRIYNHTTHGQFSNGLYEFYIHDFGAKYVSEIEYAGPLSQNGGADNGDGEKGPSPDNDYANIYGYQYGDAACIMAYTGQVISGGHHISMLAWSECGYNGEISVYVSQDNYYDWVWVSNVVPDEPWTIVDLGYTTQQFRYVGIAFCIYYGEAKVHIDCVNITP